MTIDRVLHVLRSGRMDFYSSSYFATIADAPFLYKEGAVFGYGKEGDTYVAVNLSRARSSIENWSFGPADSEGKFVFDYAIYEPYLVQRPCVPPSKVQISETEYDHETTFMDYWLSFYNDGTPKYINPSSEAYANPFTLESAEEEMVADPDNPNVLGRVFDFKYFTIRAPYTLPICNGFACFPKVVEEEPIARRLFVPNIMRYYKDPSTRNRNMVLIDFERVGGCSFIRMRDCRYAAGGIALPNETFNPKTQSLIVVLAGRILTPENYTQVGRAVLLGDRPVSPLSLMDEQLCAGALLNGPRTLEATVNVKQLMLDDNSFFVVVNRANLQIVVHPKWWTTEEPIQPNPKQTVNTYANSHKLQFDLNARGLLVDRLTSSVYDYSREEHTVTFYAESSKPISWKTSTCTVIPERPLVMLSSSKDNFMSAKGMLFTKPTDIAIEDHIAWPQFVMYDFIFRG